MPSRRRLLRSVETVRSSPTGSFSTVISIRRVFTFSGNSGPIIIDCGEPLSCCIASETNGPTDVVSAPGVPVTFLGPAPELPAGPTPVG